MSATLLLKGGTLVDPVRKVALSLDLQIEEGVIVAMEPSLSRKRGEEVSGCYLFPCFTDLHTHFREPGQAYKEPIETTLQAAAKGGYGQLVVMANTSPPRDRPEEVRWLREKTKDFPGKVLPVGAVTKGLQGEELAELLLMGREGVVGFSDDGRGVENSALTRRAMQVAKSLELPYFLHAEDRFLQEGGVVHEGEWSVRLGLRGIPWTGEANPLARDILLSQETGSHCHMAHLSCRQSLELLREAKKRGMPVTCEVTPHHLLFCDELVQTFDSRLKVNPPLRSKEDVFALREALREGLIDAIATDHAPHSPEEKELPLHEAPFGIPSLEIAFSLLYSLLVAQELHSKLFPPVPPTVRLTLFELLSLFTSSPSQIVKSSLSPIAVGSKASFVVFDPLKKWSVGEDWTSSATLHPYEGMQLKGKVLFTLCEGVITYAA